MDIVKMGKNARTASRQLGKLLASEKNNVLLLAAKKIMDNRGQIFAANAIDVENGKKAGMSEGLLDRLTISEKTLKSMSDGLIKVAELDDPIGSLISMSKRPNGLQIMNKRVPLGVIGVIFESRPNVTADVFGLCFKTGNAVILRGGSDAINSIRVIAKILRECIGECGIDMNALQLIDDTDRRYVNELMHLNEYVDVLIPRGGAGLINAVMKESSVPVIQTGTGNCHVYVDESADFNMALDIIDNAKTQRLGVCNACESLCVHESVAKEFIPLLYKRLTEKNIVIRADGTAKKIEPLMEAATEEDYGKEYLDRLISLKIVKDIDEAIEHINKYNTGHSETIVTENYDNAMRFLDEVDAACVYVNASTRFTDGGQFGFGAEIGISTQKLHARGPMGLLALTTNKYCVLGNGQVRP